MNRRGMPWQNEYYDHLMRDEQELQRALRYILDRLGSGIGPDGMGLCETRIGPAAQESRATAALSLWASARSVTMCLHCGRKSTYR
jgi:hypothetical protein